MLSLCTNTSMCISGRPYSVQIGKRKKFNFVGRQMGNGMCHAWMLGVTNDIEREGQRGRAIDCC